RPPPTPPLFPYPTLFRSEDAVAPEAKETARAAIAAAVTAGGYAPRELVLRVNPIDTVWGHADLATAATLPIGVVLLPKVENAERDRKSTRLNSSHLGISY